MNKLKEFRAVHKISQKEMADIVGRSIHTIRAIEQGHYNLPKRMEMILESLGGGEGVPMEEIIERRVQEYRAKLYKAAGLKLPDGH